jgi:hypothetical protein
MPSNSTISNNKAEWTTNANFGQIIPQSINNALSQFKTFITELNNAIQIVKEILTEVGQFLVSPYDLLAVFIKNYASAIITVFEDALSIGGSYIVIHPWNVLGSDGNPKNTIDMLEPLVDKNNFTVFKSISTTVLPVGGKNSGKSIPGPTATKTTTGKKSSFFQAIPSLTPQQAFNEFFASFSNTNDKHKPTWSVNTQATGFGFLITTASPSAFMSLLTLLGQFFNFNELTEAKNNLFKTFANFGNDTASQGQSASLIDSKDLSKFSTDWAGIAETNNTLQTGNTSEKLSALDSLIENSNIKGYHWVGLNVNNFSVLQDLITMLQKLIKRVQDEMATQENAIQEMVNALIKKITSLQTVLLQIYNVTTSIVAALEYTGIYTFVIPKGYGGVQYIQQALQSSLATSPIAATLNLTQLSALLFFGASTGVNIDSWNSLFAAAWAATSAEYNSLLSEFNLNFNYNIAPAFDTTVFSFGQSINLSVTSPNATSIHPFYYTYQLTDSSGKIISQQTETNILAGDVAIVNSSKFNIILSPPDLLVPPFGTLLYNITITIFDGLLSSFNYSKTFHVSDSISNVNPIITNTNPGTFTANTDAKVTVYSGNTKVEESNYTAGSVGSFGSSLYKDQQGVTLSITDSNGTNITLPLSVFAGYTQYDYVTFNDFTSIKFLRVDSLPIMICLEFGGILQWGIQGKLLLTFNLPTCIKVAESGIYEYYYLDNNGKQWGPYYISITTSPLSSLHIC